MVIELRNGNPVAYRLRYARKGDLENIIRLSRRSWPEWWPQNYRFGRAHIRRRIGDRQVLVATLGGEVIGYSVFGIIWSEMHFEDNFVEKRYRLEGIGSALLKRRIDIARRMGLRKVISDADVDNRIAQRYHLQNGFKRCGYIKNLWGRKDSVVFSKDL